MTAVSIGFVRVDELITLLASHRIREELPGAGLRVVGGRDSVSIYGIERCSISRCGSGDRLPDALRDALENLRTRQIRQRGLPTTYTVDVSRHRVLESGVGFGNWLALRAVEGGPRAIELGRQLGVITDTEWKQPHLQLLGIDLERKQSVYEYRGESCRG